LEKPKNGFFSEKGQILYDYLFPGTGLGLKLAIFEKGA